MSIDDILDIKKEQNGCWTVLNRKPNKDGNIDIHGKNSHIFAHRLSYILCNGEIKDNKIIRHTCDNPSCVNPEHLLSGTHKDNVMDRVERGRSAIGERHGRSKLKRTEVRDIFKDNISTHTHLSHKYGVNTKVIRDIKNKITWRHDTKDL
jgi:hypothetical protein